VYVRAGRNESVIYNPINTIFMPGTLQINLLKEEGATVERGTTLQNVNNCPYFPNLEIYKMEDKERGMGFLPLLLS